jgi:hypothetical protein
MTGGNGGAGREIGMMQIIGLDARLDERRISSAATGIVIDTLQQHRLADHDDAGIDDRAQAARASVSSRG